jgi:hypothetical protein
MLNNSDWEHRAKRLHSKAVMHMTALEGEEDKEKERSARHYEMAIARIRASFRGGGGGGGGGREEEEVERTPPMTVGAPQLLILLIKKWALIRVFECVPRSRAGV